ncbi:MAG TPA: archaeosortase A, partial [Thermococcus sp.]|nr:archaeosortase A [Thermococcus sp.]
MLAEHALVATFVLMLIYICSKKAAAGFLAWITLALACVAKIPDFLS